MAAGSLNMFIEKANHILLWVGMLTLSVTIFACLFRAILGPRFTDGIVSVNLVGTKAVTMIAILTFLLDEEFLADIAVVYAMISFLAVVVLSKCYLHRKHMSPRSRGGGEAAGTERSAGVTGGSGITEAAGATGGSGTAGTEGRIGGAGVVGASGVEEENL